MKQPLYFDGAFGTYYAAQYPSREPCEFANLFHPEQVAEVHKQYVAAGVNAIKTNTFAVNSSLTEDEALRKKLLTQGYQIACDAAKGTDVLVFCDIGYIESDRQEEEYKEIVDVFLSLGGKYFIFETLQEMDVLPEVISYLRKKEPSAVVLMSFSVSQDGYTKKGYYYKTLLNNAVAVADIVGLNCQCGPAHLLRLIGQLDLTQYPRFSAMPNAGYPQAVNGRTVYSDNVEYYAEKLLSIAALGVEVIGGCCGTTPEHLRRVIEGKIPAAKLLRPKEKTNIAAHSNQFLSLLSGTKKVYAVELDPPVDTDISYFIGAAHRAKMAGANLITVADSPLARSRADSMILAAKVKREVGIEVLPHLCCRDKNDIALKGALLGGNLEQVNNVLVVTGDPVSRSEGGVFRFHSCTLMNLISNLNQEIFLENPYTICGALNVNAPNFEAELNRAKKKKEAGMKVVFTQPVFSREAAQNCLRAKQELNCYLMVGILPIAGWKNAMFLNHEVSGINIPDSLIQKLKQMNPEEVRQASLEYCVEMVQPVFSQADGFYLMTPLKKIDFVTELISKLKKMEKGEQTTC